MKSFIAATLLFASIGFAAPADSPSPKAPSSPSKPKPVSPPNKLPDEAAEALKSGVKFILFSLEPPMTREEANEELKPEQNHHGFKILGSTELADAGTKNTAISTLTDAVRNSDGGSAMCFSPRHSLRAITSKGKIYDLLTCFHCNQIWIFSGEKRIGEVKINGTQKPLDDILSGAQIPLAKPSSRRK